MTCDPADRVAKLLYSAISAAMAQNASCDRRRILAVQAQEKVAHRTTPKEGHPALAPVFGTIMRKVATLAKSSQVERVIVARIMIKMGARQHYTCHSGQGRTGEIFET